MDRHQIQKTVNNFFKVTAKEHQLDALEFLLVKKKDVVLNLPVGFGKSLVYQAFPMCFYESASTSLVLSPLNIIQNDQLQFLRERHKEFRTDYKKLAELPAIFTDARFVAMSGTMTSHQLKTIPGNLGLLDPVVIRLSPDKTNIFLDKREKVKSNDVVSVYESIFKDECLILHNDPSNYPITIMYIPMFYMSCALLYLRSLFGEQDITQSCYSALFSNQDEEVIKSTLEDLNRPKPNIRLILSTSMTGMGFDPPSIERVIHCCPPRTLSQYIQEIGRAGRRGQDSIAILYYCKRDLSNKKGMSDDIINYCDSKKCLRETFLSVFEFAKECMLNGCKCCSFCKENCKCLLCDKEIDNSIANLQL